MTIGRIEVTVPDLDHETAIEDFGLQYINNQDPDNKISEKLEYKARLCTSRRRSDKKSTFRLYNMMLHLAKMRNELDMEEVFINPAEVNEHSYKIYKGSDCSL